MYICVQGRQSLKWMPTISTYHTHVSVTASSGHGKNLADSRLAAHYAMFTACTSGLRVCFVFCCFFLQLYTYGITAHGEVSVLQLLDEVRNS